MGGAGGDVSARAVHFELNSGRSLCVERHRCDDRTAAFMDDFARAVGVVDDIAVRQRSICVEPDLIVT